MNGPSKCQFCFLEKHAVLFMLCCIIYVNKLKVFLKQCAILRWFE